jgi:acyl dehydratase
VEIVGPRGSIRGRRVLSEWMTRAGYSAVAMRWFCGADGHIVVEQDARWIDPTTSDERGRAVVASRFLIENPHVA